jgi:hypothetical protein
VTPVADQSQGGATRPADSCETGGNLKQDSQAKEGHVMHRISQLMPALVLVRIGQELGTDSPAARAVHDLLELLASVVGVLAR